MAAESLLEEDEAAQEEVGVTVPGAAAAPMDVETAPREEAQPVTVPEAKEEEEEVAAAEAEAEEEPPSATIDVTPRTLARAMQQEAVRIEMEANPAPAPALFAVGPAAAAAEEVKNPPPPAQEEPAPQLSLQDENAGNFLGNTDAVAPASSASGASSSLGGFLCAYVCPVCARPPNLKHALTNHPKPSPSMT